MYPKSYYEFKNAIDEAIEEYKNTTAVKNIKDLDQRQFNGLCMFVGSSVFDVVNYPEYTPATCEKSILDTNDLQLLEDIVNYYIYISSMYSKEIGLLNFSKFINIAFNKLTSWLNDYNLYKDMYINIQDSMMNHYKVYINNKPGKNLSNKAYINTHNTEYEKISNFVRYYKGKLVNDIRLNQEQSIMDNERGNSLMNIAKLNHMFGWDKDAAPVFKAEQRVDSNLIGDISGVDLLEGE